MDKKELKTYIEEKLSKGKSAAEIKYDLLLQGIDEENIDKALSKANVEKIPSQAEENSNTTETKNAEKKPQENKKKNKSENFFDFTSMKWYEIAAILPGIFLLVQGGALGGLIGVLGWTWTLKIIRNPNYTQTKKIIFSILATIGYYFVYFILGLVFLAFLESVLPV